MEGYWGGVGAVWVVLGVETGGGGVFNLLACMHKQNAADYLTIRDYRLTL